MAVLEQGRSTDLQQNESRQQRQDPDQQLADQGVGPQARDRSKQVFTTEQQLKGIEDRTEEFAKKQLERAEEAQKQQKLATELSEQLREFKHGELAPKQVEKLVEDMKTLSQGLEKISKFDPSSPQNSQLYADAGQINDVRNAIKDGKRPDDPDLRNKLDKLVGDLEVTETKIKNAFKADLDRDLDRGYRRYDNELAGLMNNQKVMADPDTVNILTSSQVQHCDQIWAALANFDVEKLKELTAKGKTSVAGDMPEPKSFDQILAGQSAGSGFHLVDSPHKTVIGDQLYEVPNSPKDGETLWR